MREYIDREAVLEKLHELFTNFEPSFDHGISRACMVVKEMKAANVVPYEEKEDSE